MTLHVLVVEDSEDSREMLVTLLDSLGGLLVEFAEDGEQGLARLRMEPRFDLVFTDVGLPEMSGLAMLDIALEEGLIEPARVFVCSAYESSRSEAENRKATYIGKPLDPQKISNIVRAFQWS